VNRRAALPAAIEAMLQKMTEPNRSRIPPWCNDGQRLHPKSWSGRCLKMDHRPPKSVRRSESASVRFGIESDYTDRLSDRFHRHRKYGVGRQGSKARHPEQPRRVSWNNQRRTVDRLVDIECRLGSTYRDIPKPREHRNRPSSVRSCRMRREQVGGGAATRNNEAHAAAMAKA
jgi:hypothetical protein